MDDPGEERSWLGIDIGGTKLLAVAIHDGLRILGSFKAETRKEEGPESVLVRATGLLERLVDRFGPAAGVGAGFAGLVDHSQGRVLSSIMLPGWDGFPLAERLSVALGGLPSCADNDATAAGFGELLTLDPKPGFNMVLLTVGTGIGGAIVIDGRLYRGATGVAAEFGNATIDWRGKECWCKSRGCLNTLASGSAITARASELVGQSPAGSARKFRSLEEVHEAAMAGEEGARQAIEEGAQALGAGVANILNSLNPDRVVLSGGVTGLGCSFLEKVRVEAGARAFHEAYAHARIEYSVVGSEVGALGAACLIRNRVLNG